ncbi:MAG: hypothetical protein ACREHC_01180 [Candidatus Levyibacteriota bacterium]
MFKFLSLFKRNRDEQLADNDYDFNEASAYVDVQGSVETPNTLIDSTLGIQQKDSVNPISPIDIARKRQKEKARMDEITDVLRNMSGNPPPLSREKDITTRPEDAETPNTHHFSPDGSLFPDQGQDEEEKPPIPRGVTRFQRGDKILDWVSVDHTGNLQDRTHRTIVEAITTRNPQIVITEGHASYRGPDTSNSILDNRKEIIDWTKEQVEKVQSNDGVQDPDIYIPEAGYAAYIAQEHGIPSIGGEITGKEFLDGMKARVNHMEPEGYSPEAVIADVFMRQVERMKLEDRKAMTEKEFETKYASEILEEANRRIDPLHETNTPPLTLDQFKEWFATHPLSGNRRYIDVEYGDFTPREDGSYSQVMACESGIVRDQHIAKLIADLHNQGIDRIMSVYGLNHLEYQRPVLEDEDMYGSTGIFTELLDKDTDQQQAA